jgi:hypothetical protein
VAFAECCLGWMKEAAAQIGAQVISIDGKGFNNSYDREKGQKSLHMVSAWVSSHHLLLAWIIHEESRKSRKESLKRNRIRLSKI